MRLPAMPLGWCPLASLLLLAAAVSCQEQRAFNTTGGWSKYNLIAKPSHKVMPTLASPAVVRLTSPLTTRPSVVAATTAAATTPKPAPRWEEDSEEDEDDFDGQEIHDEGDRDEIDEHEEDLEEEELEEEPVYIPHTTQRSKGDSSKRRKPKPVKKVSTKTTRKGGFKGHKGKKGWKKLKKYMFPLLIAYKLKFLTLIPLLLGGLVLIVATTGFAGFFFALFAVGVGLKKD